MIFHRLNLHELIQYVVIQSRLYLPPLPFSSITKNGRAFSSEKFKVKSFPKFPYPDYSIGVPAELNSTDAKRGLEPEFHGWWGFYVRGENPDYPMRKRMFFFLWDKGVNVYSLSTRQIEDWTKWVEIRRQYSYILPDNPRLYPQFPGFVTLEDKLRHLQKSKPRIDIDWVILQKTNDSTIE